MSWRTSPTDTSLKEEQMRNKFQWWAVGAAIVGVLGGANIVATAVQATPSTATTTQLAEGILPPMDLNANGKTLDGKHWSVGLRTRGLTDGYVIDNKFAPGQTSGWHSHPGPSIVYVVAGSITNYASTQLNCAGVTYSAGTEFVDAGGSDVHMLSNDGRVPAETIAVQFIPDGQQRRIDKPEPANCHI
jgi:hypothetical protein